MTETKELMYQKSVHKLDTVSILASSPRRKFVEPTAKQPLIISVSELSTWLRCRVKHAWAYRHNLAAKKGGEALAIGALTHIGLDRWYKLPYSQRSTGTMSRIADKLLQGTKPEQLSIEDLELVKAMLIGYAAHFKPIDKALIMRDLVSDHWFALPLDPKKTIIVRGKLDLSFAVTALKRTVGGAEFKTKAQIKVDMVETNLQLTVYLWALRELFRSKGFRRFNIYYRILRKQIPGPRVTADLFHEEEVSRDDDEIEQWKVDTALECRDLLGAAIYPHPTDACAWDCDFNIPCLLRGNPADVKHALKIGYMNRRDKEVFGA